MPSSLQLLSKINQLDLRQRCDLAALLDILTPQSPSGRQAVSILPFLFSREYLEGWAGAAGGDVQGLRRFHSGAVNAAVFQRSVLISLCRDSRLSLFAAFWLDDAGWEEPVRSPVAETFFVLQGTVELTVQQKARRTLHVRLGHEGIHTVEAGTRYQLRTAGSSRMIVLQSRLEKERRTETLT
jgi:mannose-6-phosphate isomerase-like protein (cupin superfamily)